MAFFFREIYKSDRQIDLPLEENEDPVLDNFTEEQLADAAVLLDALPLTTLTASENGEIDE